MSLHSVSELNALADPLKQFQFSFVISSMPGTHLSSDTVELQCSSFTFPGSRIKTTEVVVGTHYRTRAALQDKAGVWRTTIYETQGGKIIKGIQGWMDLINNPTYGYLAHSSEYVRQVELQILDEKHERDERFTMYGVFPIALSQLEIKASDSSPVQVTVDWNYDWFTKGQVLSEGNAFSSSFSLL